MVVINAWGMAGREFRGLKVESVLAEGGMGVTFLASHPILKVPFVVKLVKQSSVVDVFREAHLAARVVSRHVVPIVDAGLEDDVPFMIHTFVDGIDLMELIEVCRQQGRRIPSGIACGLIAGIGFGLHAVHQVGVVHRDVKPGNIYLRGNGIAALGDFGLAVDRAAFANSNESGDWGTPNYKPPEQWMDGEISRQSDIYALGATAHAIMTGSPPFLVGTIDDLREAHLNRPYSAPEALGPRDAYAFWIIAKMLEKQPSRRYGSAETVAELFRFMATKSLPLQWLTSDTCRIGNLTVSLRCGLLDLGDEDALVHPVTPDFAVLSAIGGTLTAAIRQTDFGIEGHEVHARKAVLGDVLWRRPDQGCGFWLSAAVVAQASVFCIQRCLLRGLFGADLRKVIRVCFPPPDMIEDMTQERLAQLMLEAVRTFAAFEPAYVRRIEIVLPSETDYRLWTSHLHHFMPDVFQGSLDGTGIANENI